jgi:hypothetical protein
LLAVTATIFESERLREALGILSYSYFAKVGNFVRRSVDPAHAQAAEDGLVEGRVGTTGEERVKLSDIRIPFDCSFVSLSVQ